MFRGDCFTSRAAIRLCAISALILVFASASAIAAEPDGATVTCGLTPTEFAGLNGDTRTNVEAISQYRNTIFAMLSAQRFKQLDCVANSARSQKEKFVGGFWKLHALYNGLQRPPLHPTEQDWKKHIRLLQRWRSKNPRSITARVALAYAYLGYGWDARGHGYGDTVSRSGWKLLDQRVAHARDILTQASTQPNQCPEWYLAMQWVALAQSWDSGAQLVLLQRAVAFEPDYYYFYRMYATSILPKWGGEDGQVEVFLNQTANQMGTPAGDILYFEVAAHLLCYESDQKLKLSWPRIQRGFHSLEKQQGVSLSNSNLMARMAVSYRDVVVADQTLSQVGEQWDKEVWPSYVYFQSVKEWAKQGEVAKYRSNTHEELADANAQTPQGQRYNSELNEITKTLIASCTKKFGPDASDFELLVKIDQRGTVREVTTQGMNRVGYCVMSKLNEPRVNDLSPFPSPPFPDYWVRIDIASQQSQTSLK